MVRLAPADRVVRAQTRWRQASLRVATLEDRLAATRHELERWKERYEEKSSAAKARKQSSSVLEAGARAETTRLKALCDGLRKRAGTLASQVGDLQARLEEADRAMSTTRQQLMFMETKLELLEAAIQVLDARTREGALSATRDDRVRGDSAPA